MLRLPIAAEIMVERKFDGLGCRDLLPAGRAEYHDGLLH